MTSKKLPYLTSDLPGIGGRLRSELEDFRVEEIPAYLPTGEGEHIYAWVSKKGMTTATMVREIAKALALRDSDIGVAGMKDKYAVTSQWVSLPPPTTPDAVSDLALDDIQITNVGRHSNKLKTGHLKGNRFTLRVRDLDADIATAETQTRAIVQRLRSSPGAPNWYGNQRFGRAGDNARIGKCLVTGQDTGGRKPRGRQRRLYISAYQSQLFNDYLQMRMEDGLLQEVLSGDVLQKRGSGGMFVSDDPSDQHRLDAAELALTGPMFGHKMKCPNGGSPAAEREQQLLDREEIELASFKHLSKLANGTRRPLTVILEETNVSSSDDYVEVSFALPSGSYATAVMREIMKGEADFPS